MRTIGVEETAAVGTQLFDYFLRRHGAEGNDLCRAFQGLEVEVRREVLHHTLRHQYQRKDHADGQKHIDDRTDHIDPEVAQPLVVLLAGLAGQPTRQGQRGAKSHGGRGEVVPGQTRHLGQVAHGGLARVGLPVGVGGEADRRIEGQMLRWWRELLGIEWQHMLEALDEIGH